GGERNRVLLAKLFAKPANVIILDEPTNDLDSETLELLEERLIEYEGTLLLVSHDRAFLNNVVTSTIVFEPHGVKEYDGGYDDWLRQRPDPTDKKSIKKTELLTDKQEAKDSQAATPKQRLSYNEQRELQDLPATIETLEDKIATLHDTMAQPGFYQLAGDSIAAEQTRLKQLESNLATVFARWEELGQRE
ncbi:MAG: ABC transporter ATP-binding protein, partial [Planctomycetales bacterium]